MGTGTSRVRNSDRFIGGSSSAVSLSVLPDSVPLTNEIFVEETDCKVSRLVFKCVCGYSLLGLEITQTSDHCIFRYYHFKQ